MAKMIYFSKRVALIIAAAVLTVLPARAADTLRVGKANPNAYTFTPLEIGITKGIFERHGLRVEPSSFAGTGPIQRALAADAIDVALSGGPELAMIARGAPVIGVAAMAGRPSIMSLIARADGPVQSATDLKGRSVAVSTVGSLTEWLVRRLSQKQGWGTDGIQVVPLGANTAQVAALRTGQIDASVIDLSGGYRLEEEGGIKVIALMGEVAPDFITHVIFARRQLVDQQPDKVRRFLAAWFETIGFMRANKAEVVRLVQSIIGVNESIAARTYDVVMPMFSDTGRFEEPALAVLSQSFIDLGMLTNVPDVSSFYTEALLPQPPARN